MSTDSPAAPDGAPTLADLVRARGGRMPLAAALRILARIAREVSRLHDRGRALGVLPPTAVTVEPDGAVRVAVASAVRGNGNPALRAPELAAGEMQPDSCSDVHALGLLFRFMITGHLDGDPGCMPEELAAFYRGALSPRREDRFQTAAQLARRAARLEENAEELEACWRRMNTPVRERVGRRLARFASRQWAALCLALVLAVILGSLGWREWRRRRERRMRELVIAQARDRAEEAYAKARYRDAAVRYEYYLRLVREPAGRGRALARLVECYRRLRDPQQELATLLRYLSEFPDGGRARAFNARCAVLSLEAIDRYGGVVGIRRARSMVVDGNPGDWEGIEPLLLDPPRDNVSRAPAADLVAFYCTADEDTLYLRFDTRGPPADPTVAYCVGIDDSPRTFADSPRDWDYEIGFNARSTAWIWDLRGERDYENSKSRRLPGARFAAGTVVEASFPLAAVNNPRIFSLRAKTYSLRRKRDDDEMARKVIVGLGVTGRDKKKDREPRAGR